MCIIINNLRGFYHRLKQWRLVAQAALICGFNTELRLHLRKRIQKKLHPKPSLTALESRFSAVSTDYSVETACCITRIGGNISENMHVSTDRSGKLSIFLWSTSKRFNYVDQRKTQTMRGCSCRISSPEHKSPPWKGSPTSSPGWGTTRTSSWTSSARPTPAPS